MTPAPTGAPRLVLLLNTAADAGQVAAALRYAATAAAMDIAVEVHAAGPSVLLLRRGATPAALLAQLRQAIDLDAVLFACPHALAEHGVGAEELVAEVHGVRGAASLLAAGMAPGARFMVF